MKRIILLASCFFALQGNAQETEKKSKSDSTYTYNRLTFEAMAGFSHGDGLYGYGFTSSGDTKITNILRINNFEFGARYMITPKFGLKANLGYAKFSESSNKSLPYETNQLSFSIEGVINAARVLDFKQDSRFGLLGHAGVHASNLTSKTKEMIDPISGPMANPLYNNVDNYFGLIIGLTPQVRVTNKLALFADLSTKYNFLQGTNWDGTPVSELNQLNGKTLSLSIGLSYSLGKDNIHGDWKVLKNENEQKTEELQNDLKNKIEEIEVMLQDTDRDGVVDYLDAEPNTTGGVSVDTKGRSIDANKNGVPDDLEPRKENNGEGSDNDGEASFNYLVKQGIVNIFFDTNKDTPNTASANNLFYIINFLKNNPNTKVRAKGFADVTGDEKMNQELAQKRAEKTRDFIVKSSGVNADRVEIIGVGVDSSLDSSKVGRQLSRRVSFELIK